jgi:3-deoxy-D-manno-octulosonate 8-phosphate phosphatase (KDO 8-P phosphatase)
VTRAVTPATLRGLRLLVLDVDGVLTDGGLYYTESGEELKRFDVRDGQGIVLLHAAGVRTALVTARWSTVVERRARELGIHEVHQGVADKLTAVQALLARLAVPPAQVCYVGDDVGDLAAMRHVGLAAAPADAAPAARRAASLVTRAPGGRGAVRELADRILAARARPRELKTPGRAPSPRGRGRSSP